MIRSILTIRCRFQNTRAFAQIAQQIIQPSVVPQPEKPEIPPLKVYEPVIKTHPVLPPKFTPPLVSFPEFEKKQKPAPVLFIAKMMKIRYSPHKLNMVAACVLYSLHTLRSEKNMCLTPSKCSRT